MSPDVLTLYELGLKNQRLLARSLDSGLWDAATYLRQVDTQLTGLLCHLKQDDHLSEAEQRAMGVTHYLWHTQSDEKVRPSHAANDGKTFAWDDPPSTGHPGADFGCRCWAEPLPNDPPIESVYPIETLIGLLTGGGVARRIGREIIERVEEIEIDPSSPQESRNTQWTLGTHKSKIKWENRMRERGWTNDKITDTIKNGKEYRAPNDVRGKYDSTATATRYEKDGKFVVRDDQTGEILQISDKKFIPKDFPSRIQK